MCTQVSLSTDTNIHQQKKSKDCKNIKTISAFTSKKCLQKPTAPMHKKITDLFIIWTWRSNY